MSSSWQLARHCKSGDKAKLEFACEGGNFYLQLSASLGHPDNVHFPAPSFPPLLPSRKRKSSFHLLRQEHRREETLSIAEKVTL